ncbi:Glutathione S-transferase C-terminal-like protein [Mycena kentingensis (nom. inval.)]|nr:Glutathione S-transferase C-terminal-like protein [Mycena kentingensis (nom. inval.)]
MGEELKAAYGTKYDYQKMDFPRKAQKEEWFLKINPNGRIPAIVDRTADEFAVFETGAILQYLQRKFDTDMDVLGNAGLGPMMGQAEHFLSLPEKILYAQKRYIDETKRLLGVMELRLKDYEYLVADRYSIADIDAYPWVAMHSRLQIPTLEEWPGVKKWTERIGSWFGMKEIYDQTMLRSLFRVQVRTYASARDKPKRFPHGGKWPRPKPRTAERPPYRAPDPLENNPNAAVTKLEDGGSSGLTFIHRPPPTAPSPFSLTTNPTSPLLRPPTTPHGGPMPPLVRKPTEKEVERPRASEQTMQEIKRLRASDPKKYTCGVLARKFNVTRGFVQAIAALTKSQRRQKRAAQEAIAEAARAKWSEKHSMTMAIRKKRRELW